MCPTFELRFSGFKDSTIASMLAPSARRSSSENSRPGVNETNSPDGFCVIVTTSVLSAMSAFSSIEDNGAQNPSTLFSKTLRMTSGGVWSSGRNQIPNLRWCPLSSNRLSGQLSPVASSSQSVASSMVAYLGRYEPLELTCTPVHHPAEKPQRATSGAVVFGQACGLPSWGSNHYADCPARSR